MSEQVKCPVCGGPGVMLFIHIACDACDGRKTEHGAAVFEGYAVFRNRPPGSCEYVFIDVANAERWRAAADLDRFPIKKVRSTSVMRWRKSTGSVKDIELADRLFAMFPDADHEPGPSRAYWVDDE